MTFQEVLAQVIEWLERDNRVSYRALKRQFELDDDYLADLKRELIDVQHVAVDRDDTMLVWTGRVAAPPSAAAPPQPPQPTESPRGKPPTPEAERRQLTIMFCDLVGSTSLSAQLDPEDLREVVRAYQETCAQVVQRFDGHIAQLLGDAVLVYFGWPQAHEDEAHRAVRAGLQMLDAMETLNTWLVQDKGIRVAVRVGIHTGPVVVGQMGAGGHQEHLALGEAPNVASRIQGIAEPDTVAVSDVTYRLTEGFFTCQPLGPQHLKNVKAPMQVYRVLGESAAETRFEAATARGLTPLVGREEELALLTRSWEQSAQGRGQVVLLSGEAGIGKSRLVKVLHERVVRDGGPRIALHCSPYHTNSALYPVIEHLQRLLRFRRADAPDDRLTHLEDALQPTGLPLDQAVPLVAALLGVTPPERYAPLRMSPKQQRRQTLDTLVAWLLAEARRQPVLVVAEDLQWADPSTLEMLGLFVNQVPGARALAVLTFRPDFPVPWAQAPHLTHLTLSRFTPAQIERMATHVAGGKRFPTAVIQQVVTRTDGVPLFVEELTKTVLESGLLAERDDHFALPGSLPALAIPATLHDALMARLDRLSTAKTVAQLGATIGRTFAYELLQAVSPVDEVPLREALARLVAAELLLQHGWPPVATYTFKHALIRDAAYQSLLRNTRQRYHQQLAQVLAARFPDMAETQPELLAHHYTEAGLVGEAIPYWQRAGQRAAQRSANPEAVAHLTKGLELLKNLPTTPEHAQQELQLQITLGVPLVSAKGYAATEAGAVYARAWELCQQIGETAQLFPVLRGLWAFYNMRSRMGTAREVAEQFLSLAQRKGDPAFLLEAHRAMGITLFALGDLVSAREHIERGIALYDRRQHRSHAYLYGQDPGVGQLSQSAWILWPLGYPDRALERIGEALALARELDHPFSIAGALAVAAIVHHFRREVREARERAEEAIDVSKRWGFPFLLEWAVIIRGWALVEQGRADEGIAEVRRGLEGYRAIGAEFVRTDYLALLADAYRKRGPAAEGLRVLAEALDAAEDTGERRWEAELHRLKGELLLMESQDEPRAQVCFRQAIEVARRQQARSLELRATRSLCRLWQKQGDRHGARDLLAQIYGWFTEGFDTADLKEAGALLEELS